MRLGVIGLAALGAVAASISAGAAWAAPQILGLVASAQAIPLQCDESGCHAFLSAFCLQQARSAPTPGMAYESADEADIVLLAIDDNGETRTLPAAKFLTFTSERGYTAVKASTALVPEDLGAARLALAVGQGATLVPVAVAGDPNPQSGEEIELAAGALRRAAEPFFGANNGEAGAARITTAILQSLPERGRSAIDRPEAGDQAWTDAVDESLAAGVSPDAMAIARLAHDSCRDKVTAGVFFSMRRCLEGAHDRQMVNTNVRFWQSVGGS
jgi:hypothetical protein